MFATTEERLEEAIVRCFRSTSTLSAEELYQRVGVEREITLRALYKTLGKLIELGVIARSGKRYSLRLTYVLNLLEQSEQLFSQLIANPAALIPAAGGNASWTFRSLRQLDSFWVELMFALFDRSEKRVMYQHVPHAWFYLVHFDIERLTASAMRRAGNTILTTVGGDGPLDRATSRVWTKPSFQTVFGVTPARVPKDLYINSIGEFYLSVRLDARTDSVIENIFQRERNPQAAAAALDIPVRCRLRLEHGSKKAANMHKTFRSFWTGGKNIGAV